MISFLNSHWRNKLTHTSAMRNWTAVCSLLRDGHRKSHKFILQRSNEWDVAIAVRLGDTNSALRWLWSQEQWSGRENRAEIYQQWWCLPKGCGMLHIIPFHVWWRFCLLMSVIYHCRIVAPVDCALHANLKPSHLTYQIGSISAIILMTPKSSIATPKDTTAPVYAAIKKGRPSSLSLPNRC